MVRSTLRRRAKNEKQEPENPNEYHYYDNHWKSNNPSHATHGKSNNPKHDTHGYRDNDPNRPASLGGKGGSWEPFSREATETWNGPRMLYFSGYGEKFSGNWCFAGPSGKLVTISLQEITNCVPEMKEGKFSLWVFCDCSFAG